MRPVPTTLPAPVLGALVAAVVGLGLFRPDAEPGEVRRAGAVSRAALAAPAETGPHSRTPKSPRAARPRAAGEAPPPRGPTHVATPLAPPWLAAGVPGPRMAGLPGDADRVSSSGPASLAPLPVPPFLLPQAGGAARLPTESREFFFTRGAYSGYGGGFFRRRPSWAIDYPEADHHFITVLERLTNLDVYGSDNAMRLDDPELRRFPFVYILEVGNMDLTDDEIRGLRDWLDAGGFLVVDDFWGEREWANFEYQMARVLPGRPIVPVDLDHDLFSTFYDIDEVRQTPAIGRGVNGRPTAECAGCVATVLGIADDAGRLMVVVNWNTDLGDAWEHADNPFYPLPYSTYAYQVGVNMVLYGMTH